MGTLRAQIYEEFRQFVWNCLFGIVIRCHSSTSCAGAYDSGLVGPRLQDVAPGGIGDGILLFCPPGFCDVATPHKRNAMYIALT